MRTKITRRLRYRINKGPCPFCTSHTHPDYKTPQALGPYTSERGKIHPKTRTGVCAKHQRRLAKAIKQARHLSLLSYTTSLTS